jgi:hypothetical protein
LKIFSSMYLPFRRGKDGVYPSVPGVQTPIFCLGLLKKDPSLAILAAVIC